MKLLLIFGAPAVGKMTVGQKVAEITDMRLFHNHMAIDFVVDVFGSLDWDVVSDINDVVFEWFLKSKTGVIYTTMWNFDDPSDWAFIRRISNLFESCGAEVCYAELYATQEIRLMRNSTENRLKHKPSKRNMEDSNLALIADDKRYRLISNEGEMPFENYIKINNSELSPEVVANMIRERFSL